MKLSILDLHGQHDLDLDLQKNAHFFLIFVVFFLIFVVFFLIFVFFLEVATFALNTRPTVTNPAQPMAPAVPRAPWASLPAIPVAGSDLTLFF